MDGLPNTVRNAWTVSPRTSMRLGSHIWKMGAMVVLWGASHAGSVRSLAGAWHSDNVPGEGRGHWDALRTFVLGTSHPDRLLGGAEAAAAALGTGVDLGS